MTINTKKGIGLIPDNISYDEAAASAEGAHYAYNYITHMDLDENTKVVINGATGGIGSAALQILKYFKVYVTAVGNTKNIELLKSLGADKIYDYEKEDFTKDNEQYDYVFDAVGKSTFGKCKNLLKPNGVYFSSELGPRAQNLYLPLITKLKGGKRVKFPIPVDCKRTVMFMNDLLRAGAYKPVIEKTYAMEEIKTAYDYVNRGMKTGNVVVRY